MAVLDETVLAKLAKKECVFFDISLVASGGEPILACAHEFVNVGFTVIKMVCKKCDMEKRETP
jgi:hypothetical protein